VDGASGAVLTDCDKGAIDFGRVSDSKALMRLAVRGDCVGRRRNLKIPGLVSLRPKTTNRTGQLLIKKE
jgi:hypothetical protein